MNILKGIVTELRERRLWPVAVALLVGLVAVPVLLTKSASGTPATPSSGTGASGSNAQSVSVKLAGGTSKGGLNGRSRDPFGAQGGSTTTAAVTVARAATSSSAGAGTASIGAGSGSSSTGSTGSSSSVSTVGSTSGTSGASTGGSAGAPSGGAPSPAPSLPAPTKRAKPGPAGLTAKQSYAVSIEITNGSGGVEPIDPVQRLTALPSASQPLLVELGVEQGGKRVLFAVQPGTVVNGGGSCTPGPIDCEILSLPVGGVENISTQSAGGATIAQFSVTGISAVNHPSVAAASKARNSVAQVGAKLLSGSPLTALTLFKYEPSVGAVVDMRNLTVGGN
jgi:hypothetical protein